MKIGICFDLHNTLTDANEAWKLAYKDLVGNSEYLEISKRIDQKESREKLCVEHGLNYSLVTQKYRENLSINEYGLLLLNSLSKYFEVCLVTNSSKEKAINDLKKIGLDQKFNKIYTKENGTKPDPEYIKNIIKENNFDLVLMIGNDIYEDFVTSDNVVPLIIDFTKCGRALKLKK